MVLELDQIKRSFGRRSVLRGATMKVAGGEIVHLAGPNGAGKSTLMRIAATMTRPHFGSVTIAGLPGNKEPHKVRQHIGLVPHEPTLYATLNGREHLEWWAKMHGCDPDISGLLARAGATGWAKLPSRALSRGQKQRLSILMATLHEPALLLLDEPFTGLDIAGKQWLTRIINSAKERGAAVLIVDHDSHITADRTLTLRGGTVVE